MVSISVVTIDDHELRRHLELATQKVLAFPFRTPEAPTPPEASLGGRRVVYRPLQGAAPAARTSGAREFRLADRIREIAPDDDLYTDVEHHVLRVIRRSIQVYLQIHELYEQASGLDRLKSANEAGSLASRDEAELAEKIEAACAASCFALHAYVAGQLQDHQRDATDRLDFEVGPPAEVPLQGRLEGLHASLHHLWRAIDSHARDDASLVKAVRDAATAYARRIAAFQHSLRYLEFFTRYHYRIDPEGIVISGFELPEARVASEIQVPLRRPEEVWGTTWPSSRPAASRSVSPATTGSGSATPSATSAASSSPSSRTGAPGPARPP